MSNETEHRMHPAWAAWWYFFILGFTMCNMLAGSLPPYTWYIVFGVFLVPELIGASIKNRFGDTLSEAVVTFAQKGISRKLFAVLFAEALVTRAWTLFDITTAYAGVESVEFMVRLPWDLTMIGMGIWLPIHFFFLLEKG